MKTIQIKNILLISGLLLYTKPCRAETLDEVFRSFHTIMGITNMSVDAYMSALPGNIDVWWECHSAADENVYSQNIRDWFLSLVPATVPSNADRDATNRWLYAKCDVIDAVSGGDTVAEDTNCWFAIAREVGNVRAGFRTEHDWEVLLGHDGCEREILPCGTVVISITNSLSEYVSTRRNVRQMQSDQTTLAHYADLISTAFDHFTESQTFKNLSPQEHNAIASNIVEIGRFDLLEISRYGLTNIVENTGGD